MRKCENSLYHDLIAFILVGIMWITCQSFYNDEYNSSPDQSALGSYGAIPVSYFTGKMGLEIPVCRMTQLGVPLEVKLSYDNAGVKVSQLPGSTGHNWILQAGGSITRITNGLFDDICEDNGTLNYFHSYSVVSDQLASARGGNNPTMTSIIEHRKLYEDLSPDYYYFNFMGKKGMFFLGNDGYWKVCSDDNIDVIFNYDEEENFSVPFIESFPGNANKKQPKSIKGFTLVDENGTKYVFGATDLVSDSDPIDYSIPFSGIGGNEISTYWESQRWHLSVVQDRLNNVLYRFYYTRGPFSTTFRFNCYHNKFTYTHKKNSRTNRLVEDVDICQTGLIPYDIMLYSTVYISRIESIEDEIINFNYSHAFATDRSVYKTAYNEITTSAAYDITHNSDFAPFSFRTCLESYVKNKGKVPFYYLQNEKFKRYWYRSPISTEDPLSVTGVLKLNSIDVIRGTIRTSYSLEYNKDDRFLHLEEVKINDEDNNYSYKLFYDGWNEIPYDYSMYYVDHYGYFIGDRNWNGLPISPNTYYRAGFGNSKPVQEYYNAYISMTRPNKCSRCGLLSKIIYPTGGCQVFEYKCNEADKVLNSERNGLEYTLDDGLRNRHETYWNMEQEDYGIFCGGCRIHSIKSYENASCSKLSSIRTFKYEDGQIYSFPQFSWTGELYGLANTNNVECELLSCHPMTKICDLKGINVGYSKVTEYNSDGTSCVYIYTNISDNPAGYDSDNEMPGMDKDERNSPFEIYGDKSFGRGNLLRLIVNDKYGRPQYERSIIYREDSVMLNESSFSLYLQLFQKNGLKCDETDCLLAAYSGGIKRVYHTKLDVVQTKETFYNRERVFEFTTSIEKQPIIYCDSLQHIMYYNRLNKSIHRRWNPGWHKNDQFLTERIEYDYLVPTNSYQSEYIQKKWDSEHCFYPFTIINYREGHLIEKFVRNVMDYDSFLLKDITKYYPELESEIPIQFYQYNEYGNPLKYRVLGEQFTHVLYDKLKTVAIVRTDKTPDLKLSEDPMDVVTWSKKSIFEVPCTEAIVSVYNSNNQVSSVTKAKGVRECYQYDKAGRLSSILDGKQNILKSYSYVIQDSGMNYVSCFEYLNENRDAEYSIKFYDGFGRQNMSVVNSPKSNLDLYSLIEYDLLGRVSKKWAPIVGNKSMRNGVADGQIIENVSKNYSVMSNLFYGDSCAYSSIRYDEFDRIIELIRSGSLWKDKSTEFAFDYCKSKDVKRYSCIVSEDSLQFDWYQYGDLFSTTMTDENDENKIIFKDCFGNIILERQFDGDSPVETYYVYNELGQLSYILQPNYQQESKLSLYSFQYKYDCFGNISESKNPGCSVVYYWYNREHKLVCMQDGELRKAGLYRFYLYDKMGRLCIQGTTPQCYRQLQFDYISTAQKESSFKDTSYEYVGNEDELIAEGCNLEIVNYYDEYSSLQDMKCVSDEIKTIMLNGIMDNGYGQLCVSWQSTTNGEPIITSLGYDSLGRLCRHAEKSINNDVVIKTFAYNYCNDVTKEETVYLLGNELQCVLQTSKQNNYDTGNSKLLVSSVLSVMDVINNVIKTDTIVNLEYDALGNIISKNRSGKAGDINFGYDKLHGWITKISSLCNYSQTLFREAGGFRNRWDGTISAMTWNVNEDFLHRYDYSYDGLNRLTCAKYSSTLVARNGDCEVPVVSANCDVSNTYRKEPNSEFGNTNYGLQDLIPVTNNTYEITNHRNFSEEVIYDNNTNVISLKRYGMRNDKTYGLVDDLDISRDGNQIVSIKDEVEEQLDYYGASDFVDGEDNVVEYLYNANGSLVTDKNKRVDRIEYDFNEKPILIKFANMTNAENSIENTYSAKGNLLRKKYVSEFELGMVSPSKAKIKRSEQTLDFLGDLCLVDCVPSYYQFDEGFFSFDKLGVLSGCHYYIKDYQGNNRLVVNADNDSIEQIIHYYAYGGVYGSMNRNNDFQGKKFVGKELVTFKGLNMYDFSARLYDPNVLAFTSVDPVASETPGVSPYSYCGGDPINFIDRTGLRRLGINSVGRIFQLQDDNKEGITLYRYDSYHKKIVSDVLPFNVPKELEPIIYELEKSTKERTRSAGAVVNSHSVFSFYDWILRSGTLIEWRLDIYKKDLEYLYAFGTRFDDIGSIGTSISDIATYQTGNSERIVSIHNHLQNPNRTYGPSALYENGTVIQGDLYEAKFSKCKNYVAVYDPDISDFSYSLYRYESWPINEMPGLKFSVSFPILGGLYNNCEKILNPDWHPSWNNKWTIEWKP